MLHFTVKFNDGNVLVSYSWQAGASQPSLTAGPRCRDIPYSGYFSRGNIFVKVVILAISWKKFRGGPRGLR